MAECQRILREQGQGLLARVRRLQFGHGRGRDSDRHRQQSGKLTPRGRKLVLQYTNGSPCGASGDKSREKRSSTVDDESAYRYYDVEEEDDYNRVRSKHEDDDEDDDDTRKDKDKGKDTPVRRKSATISFLCDRDPDMPTAASFVDADPDECAYFFEVRSQHACAGVEPHKPGSVGPGSVFAIIFVIAVLVYVVGGVFYQRTVTHARGWRQLPNYSLWLGIWNFIRVCPFPKPRRHAATI